MQSTAMVDVPAGRQRRGKYPDFQLGKDEFDVRVIKVREIMRLQEITSVPQTRDFVRGAIKLRGEVIPAMASA